MKFKVTLFQFLFVILCNGQITAQPILSDTLSNSFENIVWNADDVIGVINFKYNDQMNVIAFGKMDSAHPYGNITEFKNNRFTSHNQGFCGNECRVYTTGTYKVNGNKIDLFVNTIHYDKICSGIADTIINKQLGTFYWVKNELGLHFLKDLRDLPNIDYLNNLQTHMPSFKYITSIQIISEFIAIYNRYIKIVPNLDNEFKSWPNAFEDWSLKANNWALEAKRFNITDKEEYKEYDIIVKKLNSILSDTQKRLIE